MSNGPDRPLVTFALFAYNQERFIREAVQGAFAQTYEPLEIILSDDCSTDRTFEIMQEMAAAYDGRHRVVVNRTRSNAGVLAHVIDTCRLAQGEIIVVAAGDDISYPERVDVLVSELDKDQTVYCISSGFDLIDEDGFPISNNHVAPLVKARTFLNEPAKSEYCAIQGSTAAYRRELFSLALPELPLPCAEDELFTFLAYANRKKVAWIPKALIRYRQHRNALANFSRRQMSAQEFEVAIERARSMNGNLLSMMLSVSDSCISPDRIKKSAIYRELGSIQIQRSWTRLPMGRRLVSVLHAASSLRCSLLRWQLVRFWGQHPRYPAVQYVHRLKSLFERRT